MWGLPMGCNVKFFLLLTTVFMASFIFACEHNDVLSGEQAVIYYASGKSPAQKAVYAPISFISPHVRPSIPITNVNVEDHVTYVGADPVFPRVCGDLWPATWADDDRLYTANGDGFGFGMIWADMLVNRIEGMPPNLTGETIAFSWGGALGLLWPPEAWTVSRKPTGMTCIDGVLYLFYQNLRNFLSDNEFGDAPAASVSWSTDYGNTWRHDPNHPMFSDHIFTTGMFLDYGKCNQYAMDDYVYIYGLDYNWRHSPGYRSTKLYLARVPKYLIHDRKSWEFFTGFNGNDPTWSWDIDQKTPVLTDEEDYAGLTAVGQGSIVYIPALNRYLFSTWGDPVWVFHEAPKPWGPWSKVTVIRWYEHPMSEEYFGGYSTVIPSKYLAQDGRSGWIVSSLLGALQNDYYRFGMREITIETD